MAATRPASHSGTRGKSNAKLRKRASSSTASGGRKPSQRDESTRRRIIHAAAGIYRECGYERAGMIDIARRVGMTAPALYWYFRSKEDILLAFLEHTIADLIQFVRSLVRAEAPGQRLWEFIHAYALWQLQQQELSAAYERIYALGHLRNSLPEKQRQRVTSLERAFYEMCRDLIADAQGRPKGDATVAPVAFATIGMVEHLITWFRLSGGMSVEQIAALYANLGVAMAAAVPAPAGKTRKAAAAKWAVA
ncbi:MAG: TetR/AcrR family transcriptional regulator [Burkholderiales bacterium]